MTLALDGSVKAYREKVFFTDPYIFHYDSFELKIYLELEEGGWGQKITGGTISWGDESGFTL